MAVTMLPRRFAPVLLLLAPLCACDGPSADPAMKGTTAKAVPDAAARARSDAFAAREKARMDWLEKTLVEPEHAQVYRAAIDQSLGRAAHCPDQRCIETGLRRREARLDFADGKATRIPRMPFPSGRFARNEEGYTGPVRIIPLIDGKAMFVASLSFRGRPSCAIDAVMTRDDDDAETWTVTSLRQKMPRLVFTPRGADTFDLSYAYAGRSPQAVDYCTAGTSIDGTYKLES